MFLWRNVTIRVMLLPAFWRGCYGNTDAVCMRHQGLAKQHLTLTNISQLWPCPDSAFCTNTYTSNSWAVVCCECCVPTSTNTDQWLSDLSGSFIQVRSSNILQNDAKFWSFFVTDGLFKFKFQPKSCFLTESNIQDLTHKQDRFWVELPIKVQMQNNAQLYIVLLHWKLNKTHLHQTICEFLDLYEVLRSFWWL